MTMRIGAAPNYVLRKRGGGPCAFDPIKVDGEDLRHAPTANITTRIRGHTGLTRTTTLRTLVREGVIHPLTDAPPVGADVVANIATNATTRAIWIGIREIGEQISRLADENLRAP